MSTYEYAARYGSKMIVHPSAKKGEVFVSIREEAAELAIHIPDADVPTVAAELLKAAGQESVIVPKSKKEIEDFGHGNLRCGLTDVGFTSSSEWARDRAAELLALAEYRDAKAAREAAEKAEAEATEKKLQERRDALSKRFTDVHGYSFRYANCVPSIRVAVDAYIELEDKLAFRD